MIVPACAGWIEAEDLTLDGDEQNSLGSAATVFGYAAVPVPEPWPPEIDDAPPIDDGPLGAEGVGQRRSIITRCRLSAEVVVKPRLAADEIRHTVRRHENDIRVCYNRALRRDPTLAGRVGMMFLIRGDGTVPAAAVEHSEITDPQLLACLSKTIRRWTFPVPPDATPSLVHYPYVFAVPTRSKRSAP